MLSDHTWNWALHAIVFLVIYAAVIASHADNLPVCLPTRIDSVFNFLAKNQAAFFPTTFCGLHYYRPDALPSFKWVRGLASLPQRLIWSEWGFGSTSVSCNIKVMLAFMHQKA